jgi:hypothetical protein
MAVYGPFDGRRAIGVCRLVVWQRRDVSPWHAQAVAHAIATRGKTFVQGVKDHLISNYIRSLQE